MDTSNALSTAGAKLMMWSNNSVEKASMDFAGVITSGMRVNQTPGAGVASTITYTDSVVAADSVPSTDAINTPTGVGAAPTGWLMFFDGVTPKYVKVWE